MPPPLSDVTCQGQPGETHRGTEGPHRAADRAAHRGTDPGAGGGHAEEPPSAAPSSEAGPAGRPADPGPPARPCDSCGGPEQEHRLKGLFQVLDVNGDGGICVNDLSIGLKKLGVHRTEHELMKIVKAGDKDLDGQLDFKEFVHYLRDHEKKLRLVFKSLDKKNDGTESC
ncbi:Calcium-binding mitochondrial carrier protein SCaMC-2 [Liparis tanakae]|uniref:Calcium-binding mitochondrial carrier protein SCaMC-2 n=1 Tax=Liparis tanakae TaxID=230148 RepID=A0A4Z2EKH8_9TELE|nr:Calcium-binding mitochondrial carrier protein SCaMC-2 [Liparis tanakae]